MLAKLTEVLVKQAQQFGGYMFSTDMATTQSGHFTVSFSATADALRFCHAAQMTLMYSRWPPEAAEFCGKTVSMAEGTSIHGIVVVGHSLGAGLGVESVALALFGGFHASMATVI